MTDGTHIDPSHPFSTSVVVYDDGLAKSQSFWFREHDRPTGEMRDTGANLRGEGVDDLGELRRRAAAKRFILLDVEQGATADVPSAEWTNTIIFDESDRPSGDLTPFVQINDRFLSSYPVSHLQRGVSARTLYITSARNAAGEEMVTIFYPDQSRSKGRWLGQAHTIGNNIAHHKDVFREAFSGLGRGGRVYFYGDEVTSLSLRKLADEAGTDFVNRSPQVLKDFEVTDRRLRKLSQRKLDPATTAYVNGVPTAPEHLTAIGRSATAVEAWRRFSKNVDAQMRGKYNARITSKAAFLSSLTKGNMDAVIVVAHSDGPRIYLGGESISIDELNALETRTKDSSRPRVAILLSCSTGARTASSRRVFGRNLESLADVLTKKNFFDTVIAPDHEIGEDETLAALTHILANRPLAELRQRFPGWLKLAEQILETATGAA